MKKPFEKSSCSVDGLNSARFSHVGIHAHAHSTSYKLRFIGRASRRGPRARSLLSITRSRAPELPTKLATLDAPIAAQALVGGPEFLNGISIRVDLSDGLSAQPVVVFCTS